MHPRALPVPSWFLALLIGVVAASLTGCESDRHHRGDDRDAPGDRYEERAEPARTEGQPQGGRQETREHRPGNPPWGPMGQGHDQRGPMEHDTRNQARQPESLLHRLEIGREAAREIGDQEAAQAMQRALERTRQDRLGQDRQRGGESRDGERHRLDQLERRLEELMRAVDELRRDRRDRKAI